MSAWAEQPKHIGAITLLVEDLSATRAFYETELERRGVKPLNGPMDRPWGIRTLSFADPAGYIWELAQDLP